MVGSRDLHLDELDGQRWELALDQWREGQTVVLRGVGITVRPDDVRAAIDTTWKTQIDETKVRADAARARGVVDQAVAVPAFAEIVGNRDVVIEVIDDPGMGSYLVAEMRGDHLSWGASYSEP